MKVLLLGQAILGELLALYKQHLYPMLTNKNWSNSVITILDLVY